MGIIVKRVIAYILDLIIIGFAVVGPIKKYVTVESFKDINPNSIFTYGLMLFMTLLYFAIFEYYFGQTIGKMLMRIKVKSLKGKLELWQCLLRNLSKIMTGFYILDLIYIMKSKNQRYLEFRTKTETVYDETYKGRKWE